MTTKEENSLERIQMYTYFFIAVTKGLKTPRYGQNERQQTDSKNERIRMGGGIRKG